MMKRGIQKVTKCFIHQFQYANVYIVLHQCALTRDLELFDAGDETEVGEKGLTLR